MQKTILNIRQIIQDLQHDFKKKKINELIEATKNVEVLLEDTPDDPYLPKALDSMEAAVKFLLQKNSTNEAGEIVDI